MVIKIFWNAAAINDHLQSKLTKERVLPVAFIRN